MRVILRKEVENLGDVGDVVEVADGYGMNHLIPRGVAIHATANSVRAAQHEQMIREAQIEVAKRGSEEDAKRFFGAEVEFTVRAGEDGRLFGSVTNRDIEAALAEKGLEVGRRKILLDEPIRRLGEYDVSVRLHPEVRVEVKVHVLADESAPPPEEETSIEEAKGDDAGSEEDSAPPSGEEVSAESEGGDEPSAELEAGPDAESAGGGEKDAAG
ncbi:MAG: 50S ribosomal protein L9 [Nitrospinota bacterium]|jgi:large subunit ribosomal protein L9|nr:50S ribosomal protein L9 [Nitrospinota bacterium]